MSDKDNDPKCSLATQDVWFTAYLIVVIFASLFLPPVGIAIFVIGVLWWAFTK